MFAKLTDFQLTVLRFTLAMTLAIGVAATYNWALAYIMPVLLSKFLVGRQAPTWHTVYELVLAMLCLLGIAVFASAGLVQYPLPMLLTIGLLMFWCYYGFIDPKWNFLATLVLVGAVMIPLFGEGASSRSLLVAMGITTSGGVAIVLYIVVHMLVPHRKSEEVEPPALPSQKQRVTESIRALVIAFPVVLYVYWLGSIDYLVMMIFVVILSLQVTVENSAKVSIFLLLTNTVGGLITLVTLTLITLNPNLYFYLLLAGTIVFLASKQIFSQGQKAAIYAGIFDAFLVILLSTTQSPDSDFSATFYQRIAQILAVSVYMILAAGIMDFYMAKPRFKQTHNSEEVTPASIKD